MNNSNHISRWVDFSEPPTGLQMTPPGDRVISQNWVRTQKPGEVRRRQLLSICKGKPTKREGCWDKENYKNTLEWKESMHRRDPWEARFTIWRWALDVIEDNVTTHHFITDVLTASTWDRAAPQPTGWSWWVWISVCDWQAGRTPARLLGGTE